MINSLCDISAKDEAMSKTAIGIQTMDNQMQLLRYFRDYGLDNDSDWRQSLESIMESQREDGSFPLSSDCHMQAEARVDFIFRPTYVCCQILMRALLSEKLDYEERRRVKNALSRGLAFSCHRELLGHGYEDIKQQCEDVIDFGCAGVMELADRYRSLCPKFFALINKIGDEYAKRIAEGNVTCFFGESLAREMMTAAESLGRTDLQLDKIQRYLDEKREVVAR